MKVPSRFVFRLSVFTLVLTHFAAGQAGEAKLEVLHTGAMQKMGGYFPQRLTLSPEKPDLIKQLPDDLAAPLFGVLKLGPQDAPTAFAVVVDEPEGKPSRLFVDANGNGDLRDDAPAAWTARHSKAKDGTELTQYSGGANLQLSGGKEPLTLHLPMYRFDKNDPGRAALKDFLFYYADYAREGEVALGGKTYRALLADRKATGDFSGAGVQLFIDSNEDGKFDSRYESFDVRKPFNVGGVTYEVAGLTSAGDSFTIGKSSQTVAEKKAPPAIVPGKKAKTFKAKTTAGETVDFPTSYKGKLVMLDFWATWCGPCIAELPHLLAAYEKFHPQGLEVLGISLDQENAAQKLADFTKQKKMAWPQIYDGKYWEAEIAKLYDVHSIPSAFLVDGDSGEVVAVGNTLRGTQLEKTLEQALAKKKPAQ